jgi:hypothetical protein
LNWRQPTRKSALFCHVTTTETIPRLGGPMVNTGKWIGTCIQIIGYGLTGLNVVRRNIFAFSAGIFLWFAVGVMWKDKAIMVVHVGAFISLFLGYLNA